MKYSFEEHAREELRDAIAYYEAIDLELGNSYHLQSLDWVRQIISTLERSRNVIMHSGELAMQDIERIGTAIRDWIRQVGA